MEKLLTVSVAAYNMEKYLRCTLESLALPGAVDRLEVFVVDDGGSDGSLDIAREFESRYPGCFHAVHKENGGYGTTINWSLAHATGRYFRPLDGDDWFDSDGLLRLLDALETANADAVYMPRFRVYFADDVEVSRTRVGDIPTPASSLSEFPDMLLLQMQSMIYRTDVLRAAKLDLPGGILYTDTIYACAPLAAARTLLTLDFPLYCHRLGREGQSVDKSVRLRHLDDGLRVVVELAKRCRAQRLAAGPNVAQMENFTSYLNRDMLLRLLCAPGDGQYAPRLRRYEAEIRVLSPEVYRDAGRKGKMGLYLRLLRATGYLPARALRPLAVRLMRNPR